MRTFVFEIFAFMIWFASAAPLLGNDHAFLWSADTGMQDLGTLGGDNSFAAAVNDGGAVVGYSDTAEGTTHAFLWTAEGGMQDLGVPGNGFFDMSFARAINNRGEISGGVSNVSGVEDAFVWSSATGFTLLQSGRTSEGSDINDLGTVTGFEEKGAVLEAILWYPVRGKVRRLGLLPGGIQSSGNDVNNLGHVAGQAPDSSGYPHPFYWSPTTGMMDLGVLSHRNSGVARSVNGHDEVVGETWDGITGRDGVGFYWSQDTGMVGLIALPKTTFTIVSAINNRGMIVGQCEGDVTRAVLWESYSSMPQYLGTLLGGSVSAAIGLNNRGQVVGWANVP